VGFLLRQNLPQNHPECENVSLLVGHAPPEQRSHRGPHAIESRGHTPEQLRCKEHSTDWAAATT
jgi:hypothetical protein